MQQILLPFLNYEPDKADLGGEHILRARNVIPAVKGYRPFPSAVPTSYALTDKIQGAIGLKSLNGEPFTIAGTESGIYARFFEGWELKASDIVGSTQPWDFALYGNTLIAVNGVDTPLYATVQSGGITDFQPIDGTPPSLNASVVGNFVMLGNLAAYPNAVRWCAIDNPLDWPEPGSNDAQYKQSDIQVFPEGGAVQAIVSGMSAYEGLIFCESAIYRAQYVGSPYVFQFTDVDKNRGTIAPRSVIQANNQVYFLSEDGFYATNGSQVQNISIGRVDLWWRENSDDQRRRETQAVYNPVAGVVAWAFASTAAPGGLFDRILIFHPELNRFSLVHETLEWLYTDASRGLTLEDLDAYGPLDSLPFSLDSKSLKGGVPVLASFDAQHRTNLFAGLPKPALLETSEKGGIRMFIHGARPLVDGAEASCSIQYRDFLKNTLTTKDCASPSHLDGICYTRVSTRYARVQVEIPPVDWEHAIGVELYYEEEGNL